ncbi:MAG TPA: DMT family transporter [Hyphomicrobiales bacterium]|nr:DMT family transporter [Hyphomicrobiales bacterium]
MPSPARSLGPSVLAVMLMLCLSWGVQNVAIKITLVGFAPMVQMALRSLFAAAMIWLWARLSGKGRLVVLDGSARWGLLAGALFAAEFVLLYFSLQLTTVIRATLFLYTAPFFVALGGWFALPEERLRPLQWLGLVLSFAAVALALGTPQSLGAGGSLLGDLMALGAGVGWGATTLVIKASPLRFAPAERTLFYQLAVCAVVGVLAAALAGEGLPAAPPAIAIGALAYQTLWVAGITYLIWFQLLARHPAGPLQTATTMTPLFGVVAAHLILGEAITATFAAAVALLVVGLLLVNWPVRKAAPAPAG